MPYLLFYLSFFQPNKNKLFLELIKLFTNFFCSSRPDCIESPIEANVYIIERTIKIELFSINEHFTQEYFVELAKESPHKLPSI